jgi:DHA1 family bicyclomycin/chloramphenicol resistance-like MFS transporter
MNKYLALIVVIFIAACIETDMYLPAFTDMIRYFSVTEEEIQGLLTWNFVGICLSCPIYGPLSDSLGRKKPLLVALGLFFAGSLMTSFSSNFDTMLWGRLLQGIGSGGCFTLGTAILFDVFQEEKAMRAMNQINFVIPFLMAVAPLLGGYLNTLYGFRSNFFAIAAFVLASLSICIFLFDETLPQKKRTKLNITSFARDCRRVFTNGPFWLLVLSLSVQFAGYLAFLSGTSVLFVLEFGVTKENFPFYQALLLFAWLLGNLTFTKVIKLLGTQKTKVAGMFLVFLGGISTALFAFLLPQSALAPTIAMLLYAFGGNWIFGIYFPESMELMPEIKGLTASLFTSMRLLITAIIVGLAGFYYNATIYPLAVLISSSVACTLAAILLYERYAPPRQEGSFAVRRHIEIA